MALVLQAKFNVTSTTIPTYIQAGAYVANRSGETGTSFSNIDYNGTSIPVTSRTYTFPVTGICEVNYTLTGTSLDYAALSSCGDIVEITLPEGLTHIGEWALVRTGISAITIPSTVVYIGPGAFDYTKIKSLTIPDTVLELDAGEYNDGPFGNIYSLENVNIGSGITEIPAYCFAWCSGLTSVTVPDNIQKIDDGAFQYCLSLDNINIGSGLTEIGSLVFSQDSALTSITVSSLNNITSNYVTFNEIATGGTLYYPASREETYGPASGWLKTSNYWLGYYDWNGVATGDTPSGASIYISPSAKTVNASAYSVSFFIYTSGCDLDTSNYSYSYSGDSVIVGIYITTAAGNMYLAICSLTTNTGLTDREEYVDFVFHDTSGNSYTDTCKLIQLKNVYLSLSPFYTACTSAETRAEFTIEEVNCSFDYLSLIEDSSDFGPDYPITSSVTGNKLVLSVPLNTTQNYRIAKYHGNLYDTSGNSYSYSFMIQQSAGDGVKNISASISEANVGSGSSSTSGYVYAVSCTYDHFTYMTGGSMQITVTSGANNVIYVNTPANNTSNSRVGYAYITFYDTDGNEYHQTITIRQAAGTGPGPGPQPEPTWNVLTSLTISDNEQHRFFVEAEAGKSYKANDVIYKTVSACEARYALYYINSYGGVDVMVFKGRSNKKTDNITRFNYTRSFRNNTLEFENVNYMNEMKAAWELQTGWLNDRQSKKMHELVESTCVYLYDAQEQVYIPVVMTDKTLEYKTYKNQNNRFYNYTVKVEESQSKERR